MCVCVCVCKNSHLIFIEKRITVLEPATAGEFLVIKVYITVNVCNRGIKNKRREEEK